MQLNGHEVIVFLEALGAGGVAVSVGAKLLKKLAKGHLDQDIHKVVLVLTALMGYLQYADQLKAVLPPYFMGVSVSAIYGVSQLVYKGARTTTDFLGRVQISADQPATVAPVTSETPATTQATF